MTMNPLRWLRSWIDRRNERRKSKNRQKILARYGLTNSIRTGAEALEAFTKGKEAAEAARREQAKKN